MKNLSQPTRRRMDRYGLNSEAGTRTCLNDSRHSYIRKLKVCQKSRQSYLPIVRVPTTIRDAPPHAGGAQVGGFVHLHQHLVARRNRHLAAHFVGGGRNGTARLHAEPLGAHRHVGLGNLVNRAGEGLKRKGVELQIDPLAPLDKLDLGPVDDHHRLKMLRIAHHAKHRPLGIARPQVLL